MSESLSIPFGPRRTISTQALPTGKSTGFARRNRAENDPNYVAPTEAGDFENVAEVETKVVAPPRTPKAKKPATTAETE